MDLLHELVISGQLPVNVAEKLNTLAAVKVEAKARKVLDLPAGALVVVCYGTLIEFAHMRPSFSKREELMRVYLNKYDGGSQFLTSTLVGKVRVKSQTAKVLCFLEDDWKRYPEVAALAYLLAQRHGQRMAARVLAFCYGSAKSRLQFVRDHVGIAPGLWSKQDLSSWTGISRERVTLLVNSGALDDETPEEE